MAHNENLTNRLREALAHLDNVEEKKMFRGITFMVNGKMCFSSGDNRLMVRIDPQMQDQILLAKACEVMKMKNREYRGYIFVHEDQLTTAKEFGYWIKLGLEYNQKICSKSKGGNSGKRT